MEPLCKTEYFTAFGIPPHRNLNRNRLTHLIGMWVPMHDGLALTEWDIMLWTEDMEEKKNQECLAIEGDTG